MRSALTRLDQQSNRAITGLRRSMRPIAGEFAGRVSATAKSDATKTILEGNAPASSSQLQWRRCLKD
jgi:hypothetical protein